MIRSRIQPLKQTSTRTGGSRATTLRRAPILDLDFTSSRYYFSGISSPGDAQIANYASLDANKIVIQYHSTQISNATGPGFIDYNGLLNMQTATKAIASFEYLSSSTNTPIRLLGLNIDSLSQNRLYASSTMTLFTGSGDPNWVQTNCTGGGVLNEIGPDGTTSAITLTATAGGSTAIFSQARGALGAGRKVFSVWLKAKTITGTIEITYNGAVMGWTTVVPTTSWKRFSFTASAAGQCIAAIRIQNSGDAVYVYAPQAYVAQNTTQLSLHNEVLAPAAELINTSIPSQAINLNCYGGNDAERSPIRTSGSFIIEIDCTDRGANSIYSEMNINYNNGVDDAIDLLVLVDKNLGVCEFTGKLISPLGETIIIDGFGCLSATNIVKFGMSWRPETDVGNDDGVVSMAFSGIGPTNDFTYGTLTGIALPAFQINDPSCQIGGGFFYTKKIKTWDTYKPASELILEMK